MTCASETSISWWHGESGRFADEQLGFEFLYDDSHVVVAGAQSPWVRRRKIELAELVNEPWVLPPPEQRARGSRDGGLSRAAGSISSRDRGHAPPEVRIRLLATGRFLTIVPASVLRFPTRRADIKVLPVELPMARVPIGIVTLKNRTLSPVAQLFIEHAREVAKPLAKQKS